MVAFLVVCGLLSTVYCFVAAGTQHTPSVPSAREMNIALTFWPVFILSGVALVDAVRRGRKSGDLTYFCVAFVFLPTIVYGAYGIYNVQRVRQDEGKQWKTVGISRAINPLLVQYHELHPDRFHFGGTDDEVTVDGFSDFVRSQSSALPASIEIKDGRLIDPWGRPFHLAVNRRKQVDISVCGWRYVDQTGTGWVAATISLGADGRAAQGSSVSLDDVVASN